MNNHISKIMGKKSMNQVLKELYEKEKGGESTKYIRMYNVGKKPEDIPEG